MIRWSIPICALLVSGVLLLTVIRLEADGGVSVDSPSRPLVTVPVPDVAESDASSPPSDSAPLTVTSPGSPSVLAGQGCDSTCDPEAVAGTGTGGSPGTTAAADPSLPLPRPPVPAPPLPSTGLGGPAETQPDFRQVPR